MSIAERQPKVGELRPSQMLFTFGIGSLVDLPNMCVMVMGLDDWANDVGAIEVGEERLLNAVRNQLGSQVKRLCSLPATFEDEDTSSFSLEGSSIGVPVAPFPRWMRCPRCDILAPIESGFFSLKVDRYYPDRTTYVHTHCRKSQGRSPSVLPVRFLVACKNGHLDDFPWVDYVHRGQPCDRPLLRLREFGVSGEASDIEIRCETCDARRRMGDAFSQDTQHRCSGRRPHLRDFEHKECSEPGKTILLGASNSWFPVTLSALSIPTASNKLAQLVDDNWAVLSKATSQDVVEAFRAIGTLSMFVDYTTEEIWSAVVDKREAKDDSGTTEPTDLRHPEWLAFSEPDSCNETGDFRLRSAVVPNRYASLISKVVLADRLREVRALTGFTRIEALPDSIEAGQAPEVKIAPLSRKPAQWVPALEVRGEGIFIQFSESAVDAWCRLPAVVERDRRFFQAHCEWRRVRHVVPENSGYPGIRYILLHSFSHALMRQFALECGYTSASVRERIYSASPGDDGGPQAGVLLYTATPDSEGTLGGLVNLGRPENLERHMDRALEQMLICASDPLCSEHSPLSEGMTVHGAACHACLFSSETSCERGNRYLDRAVLIPTMSDDECAFFREVLEQ